MDREKENFCPVWKEKNRGSGNSTKAPQSPLLIENNINDKNLREGLMRVIERLNNPNRNLFANIMMGEGNNERDEEENSKNENFPQHPI